MQSLWCAVLGQCARGMLRESRRERVLQREGAPRQWSQSDNDNARGARRPARKPGGRAGAARRHACRARIAAALLVADLSDGELKSRLQTCLDAPPKRAAFSIGHRGAGIVYAEHTLEAYEAAY